MNNGAKHVRVIPPGDLLWELQEEAAGRTPPSLPPPSRPRALIPQRGSARTRFAVALGAVALLLSGIGATLAALPLLDSTDCAIEVADTSGYAICTTDANATVEFIGDANTTFGSAGSGVFSSFVRVQANGSEHGYNTDGVLQFDTKAGNFTKAIKVSDIPVVSLDPDGAGPAPSGDYWELFADINEGNSVAAKLLSLNDLEVWFTTNKELTGYPFGGGAQLIYDFSGSIRMNDVNQGSGRGDLRYHIPLAEISGDIPANCGYGDASCATYFVLYNGWGTTTGYGSDATFEEFKVKQYPTIELRKVWVGTPGQTTLDIGTTVGGNQVDTQQTGVAGSAPLTTGTNIVQPSTTYYVSETGGLADYSSSLACTRNGTAFTPGTNGSVAFGRNDLSHVVCTYTNTRTQGSIELKKIWVGTPGQTTLQIGTTAGSNDVDFQLTGLAGAAPLTTGANTVDTGTFYVSETGGLADYSSSLACTRNGNAFTPGASNSVTVGANDVIVCTFTNTRDQGSIELKKVWVGAGGQTTLNIGTSAGGSQTDTQLTGVAGAAPLTTGANNVDTGTYYVSETGGLADYSSSLACTRNGNAFTPGANDSVTVGANDVVVCTFTNTRNQGSIELKKVWVGTPGQTTLDIGTSAGGSQVDTQLTGVAGAAPLTTGANNVDTGTYYVSETGGLADYTSSLACTRNGNAFTPGANDSVTVGANDVVVCTFTNTRNQGSIELKKVWVGTPGQTTLDIGTSAGGSQVDTQLTGVAGAAPLTTGANNVDTGTYYVSETGGLADYSSSLACTRNGNAFTPGANDSVTVGANDVVVCTFTNTRNVVQEGCTPGFWQGGVGLALWDQLADPDWVAAGGDGSNPFVTTDLFGSFFTPTGTDIDTTPMIAIVGTGGTENWVRKAARDAIAAYLNASFGIAYPYTTAAVSADWATAVSGGTQGYRAFHAKYSVANQLGCSIP